MDANSRASATRFYKDLSLLMFDDVVDLELCKFMFRVNRKDNPSSIVNFYSNYGHDYNTRFSKESQYDERVNFQIVRDSFLCLAPQKYSRLSVNLKNSPLIK